MISYPKMDFRSVLPLSLCLAIFTGGCATAPAKDSQLNEIRELLAQLNTKITILESKVAAAPVTPPAPVTHRVEQTLDTPPVVPTLPVKAHPAEGTGISPRSAKVTPQAGYTEDDAVMLFRNAMIHTKSQKYSQAILAFSNFLERFPDHALAGSAQYRIGEAYFNQKEYKLAIHELQRVLTSYDRSPEVPNTLKLLYISEDNLKMTDAANRHRQQLSSLFPQSPAAQGTP